MVKGLGTLDELFEAITLIETQKFVHFPSILISTEYWSGLIDWIKKKMINERNISPADLDIFNVVDSADEAVTVIDEFYKKYDIIKPNF